MVFALFLAILDASVASAQVKDSAARNTVTAVPNPCVPGVIYDQTTGTAGNYICNAGGTTFTGPITGGSFVSAKDPPYNCVGDDVADDSACFIAIRTHCENTVRANTTPGGDANSLGSCDVKVPTGTYKVTSNQVFMRSAFTTRTYGYELYGDGRGTTIIDYQPASPGPLFSNHDAWIYVSIHDIAFTCNDAASDFIDSYSTGGPQSYHFERVWWAGTWQYIEDLTGTNTNSEWRFDNVNMGVSVTTVHHVGASSTSDQFLNYEWYHSALDIFHGNFLDMAMGGHIKISNCDFSELQGSGSAGSPNILFALRGNAHAAGVTSMVVSQSRFELQNNTIKVLYSEWGSFGQVTFEDNDFSSQAFVATPRTDAFEINFMGAEGGAQYHFERNLIMGGVLIDVDNNGWGYRRNVTFNDDQFLNYDDPYAAVTYTLPVGANYGGFPQIEFVRSTGDNTNIFNAYTAWAGTHVYAANSVVYSNGYVYKTTAGGTSGAMAPAGRTASISDGGVTWTTQDIYNGSDYSQSGYLRPNGAGSPNNLGMTSGTGGAVKVVAISDFFLYNTLPNTGSTTFSRVILPPNATVLRIQLIVPSGNSQGTNGTYTVRNDNYTPVTLGTLALTPVSAGGTLDITAPYFTGTDIGNRTIILSTADITAATNGTCIVWYI